MGAHHRKHTLTGTDDHSAGTDDTLLGTESSAVVEKAFGTAASANLITQRDASGDIAVPATPGGDGMATSKGYVDNLAQKFKGKGSVVAATTASITLSAPQTIDGVSVLAEELVLVKDQGTVADNGIYVCKAGAWVRADNADTWEELISAYVWVEEGTTHADTAWACTIDAGGTLGVNDVTWLLAAKAGLIMAGSGLTKSGDTMNAIGGDGIVANTDDLAVDLPTPAAGVGGLEIDGGAKLQVLTDGNHGIKLTTTGVEAEIDDVTLSVGAGGLAVVGVPSLFEVNAVPVSATVTAVNLDELTGAGECDLHIHDLMYFTESEHLDVSAGGGDAGKPIKLDAGGKVDDTMINDADIAHNSVSGHQGGTTNEYYHMTSAEHTEALRYKADESLIGTTPVQTDFTAWAVGDRGLGIGTGSEVFLVYKDGATSIKSVQLT